MSYTIKIGTKAPSFSLKGTDLLIHSLSDYTHGLGFVVFFTCNHCPYVTQSLSYVKNLILEYSQKGISFVGINSNSEDTYPEDSFECMIKFKKEHNLPWDYLHDEKQEIALKYGALKTPHFFLFNESCELIYTGRALDNPKNPSLSTSDSLKKALDAYLNHQPISEPLSNPIGCNIKWKGQPAKWMPPQACDLV